MNSAIDSVLPDFAATAFRSHEIRGAVPGELDPRFAYALGMAIGAEADRAVVVGRDGRASSVELAAALQGGLRAAGIDVIDIGMATTPMAYFTARLTDIGTAVVVTGGDQPAANNGFKILLDGVPADEAAIERLRLAMAAGAPAAAIPGRRSHFQTAQCYMARILSDVHLSRSMKIAVDCGNGVAGAQAPRLLRELGCEVVELFTDVDGDFPNHPPDPTDPCNLQELIYCLRYTDCEIGLAFDGDGDRLGVVSKSGQIIWPDRQLILFARDLLARRPGARVLYDVKCGRDVPTEIAASNGIAVMCKAGEANIRARMCETGAELAGDMSGRFYFRERWHGVNDALYTAARLLEIVADQSDGSAFLEALPPSRRTSAPPPASRVAEPPAFIETVQSRF